MKLKDLEKGIEQPGDSGSSPDEAPQWLDLEKFQRGQLFFQRHILAIINILHQSLILGFNLRNLLEPLAYTNQSNTPAKSLKRYLQTLHHLLLWHTGDVWTPGSDAYQSVQRVRKMHNRVSLEMNSKRKINKYTSGRETVHYFSQYDMALVQSAFMSGVVMYPKQFGMNCSVSDLEDYIHFWKGIGYLLGIQDHFNICSGNYTETAELCVDIREHVVFPAIKVHTSQSHTMATTFCNALNILFKLPLSSVTSVHAFCFYYLSITIPMPSLELSDWFRLLWLRFLVFICWWFPGVEIFLSQQILKVFYRTLKPSVKEDKK